LYAPERDLMKIVTVIGARPQFIKAAVVSRAIKALNRRSPRSGGLRSGDRIEEVIIHTGQHYDYAMDRVFFEELEIPRPHYNLEVGSGPHGRQTGRMLEGIEAVLESEKPQLVLVYGDTNSTLAGALAAAKLHIPVAHVEAGLRSYNRQMPEEINRVIVDHLSEVLFCPTTESVRNLAGEGIRNGRSKVVKKVGDVMYDSVLYYSDLADRKATILKDLGLFVSSNPQSGLVDFVPHSAFRIPHSGWDAPNSELRTPDYYYLATLHRAENTDDPKRLISILRALREIGRTNPVILPVHPRTKKMMTSNRVLPEGPEIRLIEPVSYLNMLALEKHAGAILTDSGGVQKEAYWLRVPCITLREETEWVETVQSGWNTLAGADGKRILKAVGDLNRKRPRSASRLFGDGRAGEKIVEALIRIRLG
jgi:UDP-GlcNAc3NAcA epimerase